MMPGRGEIYDLADRFRAALLARERAAASEMVRVYGQIWGRINVNIQQLTRRYYESGEQNITWLYQFERLSSLRRQVESEMHNFAQYAEGVIQVQSWEAVQAAQEHAEQLVRMAADQAGVDLAFHRLPTGALQEAVGFLQEGSPLKDLLTSLGAGAGQMAADGLIAGLALGQGPETIARNIRKEFGRDLVRALRVARTEFMRSYREATRQTYLANADVVTGWEWHSARNTRTCACCWAMDGTIHTLDEILDDHPNGRCAMLPVVIGAGETRRVKTGVEAFEKLAEEDKVKVLGPAKYSAYKGGVITLQDLVGRKYNPRWGTMRYERSLQEVLGKSVARELAKEAGVA